MGERLIQLEVKPNTVLGMPECYLFNIGGALTGLKHFWSKNSLFLAIQNINKHMTNSAVFSIHSAVFSEECCMENIALLFV